MTPAEELLAQIGAEIKTHEAETHERIRRRALSADHRHVMREEWARFYAETETLRQQYADLLRTLADAKAMVPPSVIMERSK